MSNLETQTPAQIDTTWAEIMTRKHEAAHRLGRIRDSLVCEKVDIFFQEPREYGKTGDTIRRYYTKRDELLAIMAAADIEAKPFEAEWDRRNGWTRYTVVPGGHFHHYRGCSSLRWTTTVLWTPELSGMTDDEVVAKLDERACTKCFPNAPVAGKPKAKPGECATSRQAATGEVREKWAQWTAARARYAYPGLYSTFCPHCGKKISITKAGNIPGHKEPAKK